MLAFYLGISGEHGRKGDMGYALNQNDSRASSELPGRDVSSCRKEVSEGQHGGIALLVTSPRHAAGGGRLHKRCSLHRRRNWGQLQGHGSMECLGSHGQVCSGTKTSGVAPVSPHEPFIIAPLALFRGKAALSSGCRHVAGKACGAPAFVLSSSSEDGESFDV